MSTPGWNQSNDPYGPGPQSGGPNDPFARGGPGPGYPGQAGQPPNPGAPGYPAQGGYPGQGAYPGAGGAPGQPGYPGQPAGYPSPYPGQPYPGQAYQAYPGGAGLPPAPVRPLTVKLAFYDLLLVTAVSIVLLIITLNSPVWDLAVQAGLRGANTQGVTIDPSSVVTTAKILIVVIFGVFAALYLFFAFMMYGGRNWARIVLTVLGALSVLSAVSPTTGSVTVNGSTYTATNYGINWVSGILAVAAIVLMYLPQSNIYFREAKAHRKGLR